MSDPLPVNLDAVAAARERLTRALELVTTIEDAGTELARLITDDVPLIGIGAGPPPPAPDAPAPAEPTPDEDTTAETPDSPAAPPTPPPDAPNPPRAGGGRRGQPPLRDRIAPVLRDLGGAALVERVADELSVTYSGIRQAARKGIPGVTYRPGTGRGHPGLLELDDYDPDDGDCGLESDDVEALDRNERERDLEQEHDQQADELAERERFTRDDDPHGEQPLPAGMSVMGGRRRPDPPPVSAEHDRALAEPDRPAVPVLETKLKAELAEHGPNSIRGLAIRLRPADRAAIADLVLRLVATGDVLNAGRDGAGGEVLYRLA